jgi:hypothetical protein
MMLSNTSDDLEACARTALSSDFDPVPWDVAPVWRRNAACAVADAALNTNNPDQTRAAWLTAMTVQGWRWDSVFDEQKKTHPGITVGELTRGGSLHWENVVKNVRDVGRARGMRMLGP